MFYKNRYSIVFFLLVSGLNSELLQANGKIVIESILRDFKQNGLCMVSCESCATNLAKGNRTLGKSVEFSWKNKPKQLNIHVVVINLCVIAITLSF